jgi:hypothetical protein
MNYSLPKGYQINPIVRTLRSKEGNTDTILYQLNHKRNKLEKVFTSEEAAIRFITLFERERLEKKALRVNGYQAVKGVAAMHKDMEAAIELEQQASSWLSNQSQPKIDGIYLDNVNRTLGH